MLKDKNLLTNNLITILRDTEANKIVGGGSGTCNWKTVNPGGGTNYRLDMVCKFPASENIKNLATRANWIIIYQTLPEELRISIPYNV